MYRQRNIRFDRSTHNPTGKIKSLKSKEFQDHRTHGRRHQRMRTVTPQKRRTHQIPWIGPIETRLASWQQSQTTSTQLRQSTLPDIREKMNLIKIPMIIIINFDLFLQLKLFGFLQDKFKI
jgi:hypothetical protein